MRSRTEVDLAASLYGSLGATFIYLMATLVVTAPILNSSPYRELHSDRDTTRDDETTSSEWSSTPVIPRMQAAARAR